MPGCWMAKSVKVVVPPKSAARLTGSGGWVVAPGLPGTGEATWAWGSMPPGMTILPEASKTLPASPRRVQGSATATIFSPATATSHDPTPHGVTTRPPRMIRSSISACPSMGLTIGAARICDPTLLPSASSAWHPPSGGRCPYTAHPRADSSPH